MGICFSVQEASAAVEPQLLPPSPNAALSSGMQLALALALLINWLLRKRMSLRYAPLLVPVISLISNLSHGARLQRSSITPVA